MNILAQVSIEGVGITVAASLILAIVIITIGRARQFASGRGADSATSFFVVIATNGGIVLAFLGLAALVYFGFYYNTTVGGDYFGSGGIHNIGLMNNRQIGMIGGGFVTVVGVIAFGIGILGAMQRRSK
ncbi:MAG: hypothetical protein U0984_07625 [Prosthecobacter sp.]|nr:hypothetical protein [Prosthecobacter sp.]